MSVPRRSRRRNAPVTSAVVATASVRDSAGDQILTPYAYMLEVKNVDNPWLAGAKWRQDKTIELWGGGTMPNPADAMECAMPGCQVHTKNRVFEWANGGRLECYSVCNSCLADWQRLYNAQQRRQRAEEWDWQTAQEAREARQRGQAEYAWPAHRSELPQLMAAIDLAILESTTLRAKTAQLRA